MAPGIELRNFAHYTATLHGNLDTDVRLFRFDVTTSGDLTLFLQTASNESLELDLKLLNDQASPSSATAGPKDGARSDLPPVGSDIGNYRMEVEPIFELGYLTLAIDLSSRAKPTLAGTFHSQAPTPTQDSFVLNLADGTVT